MGALERYLDQIPDSFDPSVIFDSDVENIESDRYCQPLIYKYFSPERRAFSLRRNFDFLNERSLTILSK
jgi:hypothetical protein